jgi:hypothetical protein
VLSVDVLLLILRVITGAALLTFLGAVFMVLWRDYRAAVQAAAVTQRRRGRLVVVEPERAAGNESDGQTADLTGAVDALEGAELAGTSFPLLPLTSLGRGPMNTVVLNDTFCSQEHALVTWRGGQWWLEDRQSSNGTRLNGERITGPVVVSSGDVIGIGQIALKIELDS